MRGGAHPAGSEARRAAEAERQLQREDKRLRRSREGGWSEKERGTPPKQRLRKYKSGSPGRKLSGPGRRARGEKAQRQVNAAVCAARVFTGGMRRVSQAEGATANFGAWGLLCFLPLWGYAQAGPNERNWCQESPPKHGHAGTGQGMVTEAGECGREQRASERVLGWPASAKFQGRAWAGVHFIEKRAEKGKRLWRNSRSPFRPPYPIFFPPRGSASFAFRARISDLITASARVAPLGTARVRRVFYPRLARRWLQERVDQGLGVHPAETGPRPAQPGRMPRLWGPGTREPRSVEAERAGLLLVCAYGP